jgi:hypothetical protein
LEYLLQQGANPNVVVDFAESVLESVESDLFYHDIESGGDMNSPDSQRCRILEEIIAILIGYAAQRLGNWQGPLPTIDVQTPTHLD